MRCKSVLIVDDDEDIRDQLRFALESEGYAVLAAENGKRGLEILDGLKPDDYPGCILLDLMMPVMDGNEFLRSLHAGERQKFSGIKIIVTSAKGTSVEPRLVPRVVASLRKPMELEDLYRVISENC